MPPYYCIHLKIDFKKFTIFVKFKKKLSKVQKLVPDWFRHARGRLIMHGHKAFLDNNIKFYSRLLAIKNGITSGGMGGGGVLLDHL